MHKLNEFGLREAGPVKSVYTPACNGGLPPLLAPLAQGTLIPTKSGYDFKGMRILEGQLFTGAADTFGARSHCCHLWLQQQNHVCHSLAVLTKQLYELVSKLNFGFVLRAVRDLVNFKLKFCYLSFKDCNFGGQAGHYYYPQDLQVYQC